MTKAIPEVHIGIQLWISTSDPVPQVIYDILFDPLVLIIANQFDVRHHFGHRHSELLMPHNLIIFRLAHK